MNEKDISIEEVRKFWDNRPCNVKHSQAPIGTKQYFDEVRERKYFVEPHIPSFAEFEKWRGKKVLEIGCGIGTAAIDFANAGAHVTAIDYSSKSLEIAKQRAQVFGLTHAIDFIHGNAERLGEYLIPQGFDLVYSFGVIHHTPNPEAVIEAIKPFMHRDSELRVMVYHLYSWKVFQSIAREGFRFWNASEYIRKHSEAQMGSPVTYAYTRSTVKGLLKGFKIEETQVEHIFPYVVSDYREYRYKKLWYIRMLPPKIFRLLEKGFGWHLCVRAKLE